MELRLINPTQLPYLTHPPSDGRAIPIIGYYDIDQTQFYAYSVQPNGMILILTPLEFKEGIYISKQPAAPNFDCRLEFLEVAYQHFSFNDVLKTIHDLEQDIINGLASIHEYFVLLLYANQYNDFAAQHVLKNVVENAFGTYRSFYDLLHEVNWKVHKKFENNAPTFSDSFERYVNKSEQELAEIFLFPQPIVEFYKSRENKFKTLRAIRNNIFHHGHSPDLPFRLEDGFAFRIDDDFASKLGDLDIWPENLLKPNDLGSVLAIIVFLYSDMHNSATELSFLLRCITRPLKPIASGFRIFLRSSLSKHLLSIDDYGRKHWFNPKEVLGIE